MTKKPTATVLTIAGLALTLTGCTADTTPEATATTPTQSTTQSATPTETQSPAETTAPAPTETETPYLPTLGETVTEDKVQAVKEAGYAAYQTTDGSYVVVDPHQDLPDTVKADLVARTGASGSKASSLSMDPAAATKAVNDWRAAGAAAATVGKKLITVGHYAHLGEGGVVLSTGYTWAVVGHPSTTPPTIHSTKAAAMAEAEAWVAAQADPTSYVVVDSTHD